MSECFPEIYACLTQKWNAQLSLNVCTFINCRKDTFDFDDDLIIIPKITFHSGAGYGDVRALLVVGARVPGSSIIPR